MCVCVYAYVYMQAMHSMCIYTFKCVHIHYPQSLNHYETKQKSDDYHKRQTINFWYVIYVDLECEICHKVLHSWHYTEKFVSINNTTRKALI